MWLGSRFSALPMEIGGFESPSKSAGKQTRKRAKLGDSGEKKFNAARPAPGFVELQLLLVDRLQTQCGVAEKVSRRRHYHPHLTIAFRDLKRRQFGALWEEVRERSVHYAFTVTNLTLLWHDGKRWQVDCEFALSGS